MTLNEPNGFPAACRVQVREPIPLIPFPFSYNTSRLSFVVYISLLLFCCCIFYCIPWLWYFSDRLLSLFQISPSNFCLLYFFPSSELFVFGVCWSYFVRAHVAHAYFKQTQVCRCMSLVTVPMWTLVSQGTGFVVQSKRGDHRFSTRKTDNLCVDQSAAGLHHGVYREHTVAYGSAESVESKKKMTLLHIICWTIFFLRKRLTWFTFLHKARASQSLRDFFCLFFTCLLCEYMLYFTVSRCVKVFKLLFISDVLIVWFLLIYQHQVLIRYFWIMF